MMSDKNRARWVIAIFVAAPVVLSGCYVKDQLLAPQNPGLVDQTAVQNANAALALRVGAIGRVRNVVDGGDERLFQVVGHIMNTRMLISRSPAQTSIAEPSPPTTEIIRIRRSRSSAGLFVTQSTR